MDQAMWFARMALLHGGGWLAARGYGDAAFWEAAAGIVSAAIGAVWSYRARKALTQ